MYVLFVCVSFLFLLISFRLVGCNIMGGLSLRVMGLMGDNDRKGEGFFSVLKSVGGSLDWREGSLCFLFSQVKSQTKLRHNGELVQS